MVVQDEIAKKAVETALREPGRYVLKPQREGGGNNLYDDELKTALSTWSKEQLGGLILMERIFPPQRKAMLVRQGKIDTGPTISELGVFGTYLGNEEKAQVVTNRYAGYLVRTKMSNVNEGGVATGYAVVNSLIVR